MLALLLFAPAIFANPSNTRSTRRGLGQWKNHRSCNWTPEWDRRGHYDYPGVIWEWSSPATLDHCKAYCKSADGWAVNWHAGNGVCRCYSSEQIQEMNKMPDTYYCYDVDWLFDFFGAGEETGLVECTSGLSRNWQNEDQNVGTGQWGVLANEKKANGQCHNFCKSKAAHSFTMKLGDQWCRCYSKKQIENVELYDAHPFWVTCKINDYFDPKPVCQDIINAVNDANGNINDDDGNKIDTVEIDGEEYDLDWDIWDWTGVTVEEVSGRMPIKGPISCNDQSQCGFSYTETKSQTKSWTSGSSFGVSFTVGGSVSAGIPAICDVEMNWSVGTTVETHFDTGVEASFENSEEIDTSCAKRDYKTTCWVYETEVVFDALGLASPIFTGTFYGYEDEQIATHNCRDYDLYTEIHWHGMSAKGIDVVEQPVCTDTLGGWCDHADEVNCALDDGIRQNCPETCGQWGWGPPVCPGPDCEFVEVPKDECPPLNSNMQFGKTCREVYNQPYATCEAIEPFLNNMPEVWNVKNCKNEDNDVYHNIFRWECNVDARKARQAHRRAEMASNPIKGMASRSTQSKASRSTQSKASRSTYSRKVTESAEDQMIVEKEGSKTINIYMADKILSSGYDIGLYGMALFGLLTMAKFAVKGFRKAEVYAEITNAEDDI